MIDTNAYDEEQECDGTFVVDTEDDTAFFNMNLGGTFGKKEEEKNDFEQFGGLKSNWKSFETSKTVVSSTKSTSDPSKCDKNCASCVWATFCKSASKGLAALASGSGFIPKLG